jgi:hypothetical protein
MDNEKPSERTTEPLSNPPESGHDDFSKFCNFLMQAALAGPNKLRKHLAINEATFRSVAAFALEKPKEVYLYRVLDEIQKAGVSINLWFDYLNDAKKVELTDSHIERVVHESIIDDQSFRARKLIEGLVELICFSETDEEIYYRDFFLLHELSESIRAQRDRKEFFAFESENTAFAIQLAANDIRELEKGGLDPKKRWYLANPEPLNANWIKRGPQFSSFRTRYKKSVRLCIPSEAVVIGKSYIHAYGMSKNVHFTAGDTSSDFDADEACRGLDRVGLLCLSLLIRCQISMNIIPDGVNRQLRDMYDSNVEAPKKLVDELKAEKAVIGDFIWASGYLAEVIESKQSDFGFRSYRVRYLQARPISSISEDWFAAGQIRLFLSRKNAELCFERVRVRSDIPQAVRDHLVSLFINDKDKALREFAMFLWLNHDKLKAVKTP